MESMTGTRLEICDVTLVFDGTKVNGINYKVSGSRLTGEG